MRAGGEMSTTKDRPQITQVRDDYCGGSPATRSPRTFVQQLLRPASRIVRNLVEDKAAFPNFFRTKFAWYINLRRQLSFAAITPPLPKDAGIGDHTCQRSAYNREEQSRTRDNSHANHNTPHNDCIRNR